MSKGQYIKDVQKLSYSFAKFHYDDYLKQHKINKIEHTKIENIVNDIYDSQKKNELASFVRQSMKMTYKNSYNSMLTENILNEIFLDDTRTKTRIITEIELLQRE